MDQDHVVQGNSRKLAMRAVTVCLIGIMLTGSGAALAQSKPAAKTVGTPGTETRYFTSIDGLMEGNADVILKETLQGKVITAATLDVCYPAEKGSDRKDRFVANLTASGQTLTGTSQSQNDKLPVTVKLTRKPTADTFEFRGQISVGQTVTEVLSTDNSDLSEKEYLDNQATEDSIAAAPKDFTEVSPESIGVKVKLEAAADFLKGLKGQNLEVLLSSLVIGCDSLRAGEQSINITVDPDRAAAFIAKVKAMPGVVSVGWTSGLVDMERTIRFAAAEWRDGDKLNRDKLAAAVGAVLSKTLAAKLSSSKWSDDTGKLKLTLKRPSQLVPALELTETIEVTALAAADRPGNSDHLMLWISNPAITTADEGSGAKLNLADAPSNDEEGDQKDDTASVDALAKEFKAQRWDADKSAWK
jgi:hypothetical protein